MSNVEADPTEVDCPPSGRSESPPPQTLKPREVPLGGPRAMRVRRVLPHRQIRTIGPWCFVDHYGPELAAETPMVVPPHPHVGLQTLTWLMEGEVVHRDSVGSIQTVRPGELSFMTAGHGIAHSEYSTPDSTRLFGVQFWLALPSSDRNREPFFEFHRDLPTTNLGPVTATVIIGDFAGHTSPASQSWPTVGIEFDFTEPGTVDIPINPEFEHGVLAASTRAEVAEASLEIGDLEYLGWGQENLRITADQGKVILIGGAPFTEHLVMWWNFVGRSHEDILQARDRWMEGVLAPSVTDDPNAPLPAPELPSVRLRPRPNR